MIGFFIFLSGLMVSLAAKQAWLPVSTHSSIGCLVISVLMVHVSVESRSFRGISMAFSLVGSSGFPGRSTPCSFPKNPCCEEVVRSPLLLEQSVLRVLVVVGWVVGVWEPVEFPCYSVDFG